MNREQAKAGASGGAIQKEFTYEVEIPCVE